MAFSDSLTDQYKMAKFHMFGEKSVFNLSDEDAEHLPHHVLLSRSMQKFVDNLRSISSDYFFIDVFIAVDYLYYDMWVQVLDPDLNPDIVAPIFHRVIGNHLDGINQLTDGQLRSVRMHMVTLDYSMPEESLLKHYGQLRAYYAATTTKH